MTAYTIHPPPINRFLPGTGFLSCGPSHPRVYNPGCRDEATADTYENQSNRLTDLSFTNHSIDQVKMSWGEPEKITRTAADEQWTYRGETLVFKNGVMTGMQ